MNPWQYEPMVCNDDKDASQSVNERICCHGNQLTAVACSGTRYCSKYSELKV